MLPDWLIILPSEARFYVLCYEKVQYHVFLNKLKLKVESHEIYFVKEKYVCCVSSNIIVVSVKNLPHRIIFYPCCH